MTDNELIKPSILYRPSLFADGTMWCVLLGSDLASGVAGFGTTPAAAMHAFDVAFRSERTPMARLKAKAEARAPMPEIALKAATVPLFPQWYAGAQAMREAILREIRADLAKAENLYLKGGNASTHFYQKALAAAVCAIESLPVPLPLPGASP